MKIKILGTGCPKCKKLYAEAQKAVDSMGVNAQIERVERIDDIMDYGVMMTPALVINEEVKTVGRVPSASKIAKWLKASSKEGSND